MVEDDSQLHAAEAQVMGHGPAAGPGEGLLSTDAFIDTVARHRGLRRLDELVPFWVRASFDGL